MHKFLLSALLLVATPALSADYVSVRSEATLPVSPDAAWKEFGEFCQISRFLPVTCEYSAGKGEVGSVRTLNGKIVEPMIAQTRHSYTYGQTVGDMQAHDYHGTVAVEPEGSGSRIIYTLVYDQASLPSDEARATARKTLQDRFDEAVRKIVALFPAKIGI